MGRRGSERGRSKFDKAGNLLFRTAAKALTYFRLSPRFSTRSTLLIFDEGGILLFSFIKYTDPRRDSILLGGLLFVVPSPASVTGSPLSSSFVSPPFHLFVSPLSLQCIAHMFSIQLHPDSPNSNVSTKSISRQTYDMYSEGALSFTRRCYYLEKSRDKIVGQKRSWF